MEGRTDGNAAAECCGNNGDDDDEAVAIGEGGRVNTATDVIRQ